MTIDTFPNVSGKQIANKEDGSKVFLSGPQKGLLVRPYSEKEVHALKEKGWEILKEEISPRKSRIILLRKHLQNS